MSYEEDLALVADSLMLPSDQELLLHSSHHPLATPLSSIPEMQWLQPLAAEWDAVQESVEDCTALGASVRQLARFAIDGIGAL
jgi:hypothetical protein